MSIVAFIGISNRAEQAYLIDEQNKLIQKQQLSAQANQVLLDSCLLQVETNYSSNWAASCKAHAKTVEDGYKNCLGPYTDSQFCRSLWGTPDSSKNCSLPSSMAQNIESLRTQGKQECYYRYPIR